MRQRNMLDMLSFFGKLSLSMLINIMLIKKHVDALLSSAIMQKMRKIVPIFERNVV